MVTINKIYWKRTYLFIEYKSNFESSLYLIKYNKNNSIDKKIKMNSEKIAKEIYSAKINVTIAEGRELLSKGEWILTFGEDYLKPEVSEQVLLSIEDYSRIFKYGINNTYAYLANFEIKRNNESFYLALIIDFMKRNKNPYKRRLRDAFLEGEKLKDKLRIFAVIGAQKMLNIFYQIISHMSLKKGNRILFMSENRTRIMDNLEAIDRRIKERNLHKQFKISYSFRNIFNGKRQNPLEWLKVLTKVARSDYIFVDDYVPIFSSINLSKKQTLVQVWHAGFGFKLVGYGRFGIEGSPRPKESCHRKYTYGIIGNENLKEIYSEVWGIPEECLLPTGMPRLEHFLDKDYMEQTKKIFYEKYPELKGKKIITFAPTYRGFSQLDAYYDYDKIDFDRLYEFCKKNNFAVAFGKHHFIRQEIPIKDEYKDLIFDMSSYKLNDLFYVTDILITDYSSAFYDFLLLNRPVLFFVYDKALYSATRGVHRPIDDVVPGKVCESFDELLNALVNKDYGEKEKADFLIDNCIKNKKMASDQIIDYVILKERDRL